MVNPASGFYHISIRYLINCKQTRLQAVDFKLSNTLPLFQSFGSWKLDFSDRDYNTIIP